MHIPVHAVDECADFRAVKVEVEVEMESLVGRAGSVCSMA
jgi:hypothetical protein